MRRWLILLALFPVTAFAQVRAWEKIIAPGLTYRMEVDFAKPLTLHAYRWSPLSEAVRVESGLGGPVIFGDKNGEVTGRETMGEMVLRTKALAGINADFFPFTGDPLGLMIRGGEVISGPWPNRSAVAWGPGGAFFGPATLSGSVTVNGVKTPLAGINQESANNDLVLNMGVAGRAEFKEAGVHVVLKTEGSLRPVSSFSGEVVRVVEGEKLFEIPAGSVVLSAAGKTAEGFKSLQAGAQVSIELSLGGFDFSKVTEAAAGGPMLLKGGKALADGAGEGFSAAFWNDRHPRTAIGATATGDVWMVVVDGRQAGLSRGVSLTELGAIMQKLGCTDAINLDGGGSSDIVLAGLSVNRPSGGAPRPVANGILIYSADPLPELQGDAAPTVIQGRPTLTMGVFNQYKVLDGKGNPIDNGQIIWSAQGSAWVDQGGFLRGLKPGEAFLRAWVAGKILEVKVMVEDPAAPPVVPPTTPPPGTPPLVESKAV